MQLSSLNSAVGSLEHSFTGLVLANKHAYLAGLVWRLAFKITTNTFGDMFGDVIKKLERSKELLLQSANVAHFHEAQEARLLFSREIESLRERATKDRMLTVVDWLSPTSCTGDHEELQDKRREFPDTAQWILKEPCMRDWLRIDDAAKRTFWICGIPGAGRL